MLMSREFGDSSRGATDGRRGSHPQIHEVHRSPERSAPLIRGAQRRRTVGPRGVVDGGTHYVHDSQSRQEARVRRSRQSVRLVDRALPLKNLGARPIEYRDRAQAPGGRLPSVTCSFGHLFPWQCELVLPNRPMTGSQERSNSGVSRRRASWCRSTACRIRPGAATLLRRGSSWERSLRNDAVHACVDGLLILNRRRARHGLVGFPGKFPALVVNLHPAVREVIQSDLRTT